MAYDAEEVATIAEIPLPGGTSSDTLFVIIERQKSGKCVIDVRRWFVPADEEDAEWRPTQKGLKLSRALTEQVMDALTEALAHDAMQEEAPAKAKPPAKKVGSKPASAAKKPAAASK